MMSIQNFESLGLKTAIVCFVIFWVTSMTGMVIKVCPGTHGAELELPHLRLNSAAPAN